MTARKWKSSSKQSLMFKQRLRKKQIKLSKLQKFDNLILHFDKISSRLISTGFFYF